VLPAENGGDARIRIFTPRAELPFAGHPTLGSAFVLCGQRGLGEITLETGAGPIQVTFAEAEAEAVAEAVAAPAPGTDPAGDADGQPILPHPPGLPGYMLQPIPHAEPYDRAAELLSGLGLASSALPVEVYRNGPMHVYVAMDSEDAVAGLEPDLNALAKLPGLGISCFAGRGSRWKTRNFAPALGVSEDPATGSAAGPLAVHLARHGWTEFGQQIEIRQGAEIGRPSILYAQADGTASQVTRVAVGGSAVVVGRGEFLA
jgi:trans-2,3-dihydro-3-hydroxyanthranilate isomerase